MQNWSREGTKTQELPSVAIFVLRQDKVSLFLFCAKIFHVTRMAFLMLRNHNLVTEEKQFLPSASLTQEATNFVKIILSYHVKVHKSAHL